jgi:3-deoxy-D-manno-octulosonic-acid transferase
MRINPTAEDSLISLLHFGLRALAFPLLVVYWVSRGLGDRRYLRTLPSRLGFLPRSVRRGGADSIWLHAVSVGEVLSSVRLVHELRAQQPKLMVFVSTSTLAGYSVARQKLAEEAHGVFYAPADYAFAVRRVLRRIQPSAVVILETEIWPLLYREAKRAGCALVVVNGRISDRALPRYHALRFFFRWVLGLPDAIYTQSEQDRARYLSIGAPAAKVHVLGNLKYDTAAAGAAPKVIVDLVARLGPEQVWIAASTMPPAAAGEPDEDELVVRTFQQLAASHPRLLMIHAPRRPERFEEAAARLKAAGISFLRRSTMEPGAGMDLPGVLLLDTIGELASVFPLATVVFMGGTLPDRGGHNLLEPAAAGRAIVSGPHLENFPAIAREFRDAKAMYEIERAGQLAGAVEELLNNREMREALGRRALELAEARRGVTAAAARHILTAMDEALPAWRRTGLGRLVLWPLSRLWAAGAALDRRRKSGHARVLPAPVVSIGGIAIGGVGKTPLCAHLAERLTRDGYRTAILTRGYRRRSLEEAILVEAGARAPVCVTGDEAQILVRFSHAHVGIGADRFQTGSLLAERLGADVFLLDDGFQHYRLHRDVDLVLIDALDPFSGGDVAPLGRLREPLSALRRASAFLITRAQPGRSYAGIRRLLAEYNPGAPVFLASLRASAWINERTRQAEPLPPEAPVAFCGLGNPEAFWRTMHGMGIEPVFRWTFPDHHVYTPLQLKRLARQARARGATALVTTEKDAMNLPQRALEAIAPLNLYWLKIETSIAHEDELMQFLERRLPQPVMG